MKKIFSFIPMFLIAFVAIFGAPIYVNGAQAIMHMQNIVALRPGDPSPFPIDPQLTTIMQVYSNTDLIADQVAPRKLTGKKSFRYLKLDKGQMFTIPNTAAPRKGELNKVEFGGTMTTDYCSDYGLASEVTQEDIENAAAGIDPAGVATEGIAKLVALDREVRTASLLFDPNNFASTNKAALSGNDRWDIGTSDIIGKILAALNVPLVRPNIATVGAEAWGKIRVHPQIVSAVLGNPGDKGVITQEQFAKLFELKALYVGVSRINTAKKGQTVTIQDIWGKSLLLSVRDVAGDMSTINNFAVTAQYGDKVAGKIVDEKMGLKGGYYIKGGESVKEVIQANDLGYLFTTIIS